MAKSIQEYKNEIKNLEDRRQKIELEVAKLQAKKESYDTELKTKFGISYNEIDSKLEEYKTELETLTKSLDSKIAKANEYITKLETILNG